MFGQRAGRSVFNTPTRFTHFRPIFGLLFENRRRYADGPLLPCTPFFVAEQAAMFLTLFLGRETGITQKRPYHASRQM